MNKINIKLITLLNFKGLEIPKYATIGSSGLDVRAAINHNTPIILKPNSYKLIVTGLSMEIPKNYEIQIRPRSGLALNHGITIINSPGTIDSDYRGEIGVLLMNLSKKNYIINRGDRIAQLIMSPIIKIKFNLVKTMNKTNRNIKGYGSTNIK